MEIKIGGFAPLSDAAHRLLKTFVLFFLSS